ncbi:uncharacterized protein [Palaemon carinicauda]|uniref:uncharacterized protein n=1 Tax=Palaemon carinicauda TaxID=392227 RepID=UPI0035B58C1A
MEQYRNLPLAGGKAVAFLLDQLVTQYANLILKKREAVTARLARQIGSGEALALRNTPIRAATSLFPPEEVRGTRDKWRLDSKDFIIHQAQAVSFKGPGPAKLSAARPSQAKPTGSSKGTTGRAPVQPRPAPVQKGSAPKQTFQPPSGAPPRRGKNRGKQGKGKH